MQQSNDEFNMMYSFLCASVVHFYNKCNEESHNSYYSQFLDLGFTQSDYLEFVELMYKNMYEDLKICHK